METLRLLITSILFLLTGITVFIFPNETTDLVFIGLLSIIIIRIISNMFFWGNVKNKKKFLDNLFIGIFVLLISYFVYKLKSSFVLFFQIGFIFFFLLDFINRIICFVLVRKENIFNFCCSSIN